MRPHIIVHSLQSIDGRVAGRFFSQAYDLVGEYAAIREDLDAECIIYGATTASEVLEGVHAGRPTQVRRPVPAGDYVAQEADFYFAIVDPEGTLNFDAPTTSRGGTEGHIVLACFGVQRALLMGGGYADGTFAAADCVDELSLVVAPVAEVTSGQPALFETMRGLRAEPLRFELAEVRQLPSSGLWLHYLR